MGAEYCTMVVKGQNREEARKQFEQEQENDRYENGHSYSGGLGMAPGLKFTGEHFSSYEEADEYLSSTCEKWEDALAVSYKDENGNTNFLIGALCSS